MSGKRTITCRDCGRVARNQGKGLCARCYSKHRRQGTLERFEVLPEPTQGQSEDTGRKRLVLLFDERDAHILEALCEAARLERRSPVQQVMWILERHLATKEGTG